jgi:hypothetical protein
MEVIGQLHAQTTLPPSTHRIVGWVGPRAGMDVVCYSVKSCHRNTMNVPDKYFYRWNFLSNVMPKAATEHHTFLKQLKNGTDSSSEKKAEMLG